MSKSSIRQDTCGQTECKRRRAPRTVVADVMLLVVVLDHGTPALLVAGLPHVPFSAPGCSHAESSPCIRAGTPTPWNPTVSPD